MLTRRRVIVAVLVLLAGVGAFLAWQIYSLERDLARAEQAADRLRTAIDQGDRESQTRAVADLRDSAAAASDRASAFWYDALTVLPVVGDDVRGVQVLSTTLSDVADGGLEPLVESLDGLDSVVGNGRIDVQRVRSLRGPVAGANDAFAAAATEIEGVDSSGFFGPLQRRFDEYADVVSTASRALASADTAVQVLPALVGANEPVDYLLIFQNNAEIRATGGMAGAWARLHADNGELSMARQGISTDFKRAKRPVLPLTDAEVFLYGTSIGTHFQRSNSTPDFPRAAQFWRAHWDRRFPGTPIDGVIALDPVGMSYLLEGIGPVRVGDLTLTSENLVQELLRDPYLELDGPEQDEFFARSARTVFDETFGDLDSPLDLVEGLRRAASERRLLVAAFDDEVREGLEGSDVQGALRSEPSDTPYVDIGVDAANGTKMSYYLRYEADIESLMCPDDRQRLEGTMTLSQAIRRRDAARLPTHVRGNAEGGKQFVNVRIYGPVGGTIEDVTLNDNPRDVEVVRLGERPVAKLRVLVDTMAGRELTWSMETGPGQTGDVKLRMTPGVLPGANERTIRTECG